MRSRSGAVLAIGLAALLAAWAFGSRPLVPVAFGLLLVGGGSMVWVRIARAGLDVERSLSAARLEEGGSLTLSYVLRDTRRLPGSAWVVERIAGLGEWTTELRGRASQRVGPMPRGRYALSGEAVRADPLEIESVRAPLARDEVVLVHPHVVELDGLFTDSGSREGPGRAAPVLRPSGLDVHSVREHAEGESLHKVHWPSTARRGRLMVRELDDRPRDDLVVVLDCDADSVVGPPGTSSLDAQARAAGSLLRAHVSRGKAATLLVSGAEPALVRVTALTAEWPDALDALAAAAPATGVPLATLLGERHGPVARARDVTLVTSRLSAEAVEILVGRVGGTAAVVWVDAASFAGRGRDVPEPALLRLASAGVPVSVVARGDDLRAALEGDIRRRISA